MGKRPETTKTANTKPKPTVIFPKYMQFSHHFISLINWFYRPFRKFIPHETFTYAATGGFNTALDIFLYFIFYNFILRKQIVDLGFVAISPYIAAFIFVFPITFTSGFMLGKYVTFTESLLRGRKQLFRYGLTVAGAILLNYVLLKLFVEYMHIWPTISKIITTIFVVVYSYLMQRYFTFKTGQAFALFKRIKEKRNKKNGS